MSGCSKERTLTGSRFECIKKHLSQEISFHGEFVDSKVFPKIKSASSSEKTGVILLFFPFMLPPGTGMQKLTISDAGRKKKN